MTSAVSIASLPCDTLTSFSESFGRFTVAIALNQPQSLQFLQALDRVGLELLGGDLEVGFERSHYAFETNSRRAQFDRQPDTRGYGIQAVTKTFIDIEKYAAVLSRGCSNIGGNLPFDAALVVFHGVAPNEIQTDG